ncbi:nuclear transport factor 2 family protein [Nonomuraea candida]|uniref:nuclear transport factor 2 family protein n=1 Tax=Nonomuraea candida TaxID=359159 RepID=UPI0005B78E1A|nr:nuclear transport factor 2 family protein [Nonomuraea candida]
MSDALHPELRRLLDREALRELIHAYAQAADRRDLDKLRLLYHDDAVDEHGRFSQGSAMEFIDRLPEIQKHMAILQHHITTVNLKVVGDEAEGEVYVIAFHQVDQDGARSDYVVHGRYLDKYSRRDGVWKFSRRALVADWMYVAEPSAVRLDHPFVAGSHIGAAGEDDPSYGYFSLLRRGRR